MKKNRGKGMPQNGLIVLAGVILSYPAVRAEGADRKVVRKSGVDTADRHDADEKPDGRKALEDKEILREAENAPACMKKFTGKRELARTLDSLETKEKILKRLGEGGYSAVDWDNQLDMYNFESMKDFCIRAAQGAVRRYSPAASAG